MKKQEAIERAGSVQELASIFNISHSAISQWGEEIPPMRVYQLMVLKPAWFKAQKRQTTHIEVE